MKHSKSAVVPYELSAIDGKFPTHILEYGDFAGQLSTGLYKSQYIYGKADLYKCINGYMKDGFRSFNITVIDGRNATQIQKVQF